MHNSVQNIYFSSLHVSGIHVPIIRKKLLYPCVTGTCHTVCVSSGLLVGVSLVNGTRHTVWVSSGLMVGVSLVTGTCHTVWVSSGLLVGVSLVTGTRHTVWVSSGLLVGFSLQPAYQTTPIQCDKYQWRMDTVIFSWWWAHGCSNNVEKRNKYIEENCAPSWIYLRGCTGMHSKHNKKHLKNDFYLSVFEWVFIYQLHLFFISLYRI